MKRSRSGQAGFAGLWRRCRFQSATAISAMPMGMPGCPDLAASTASIASARMELASSASVALAVTEESIGTRKLYSAPPMELPFYSPQHYEPAVSCEAPGEAHWFVFRGDELAVEMGPLQAPSDDPRVKARPAWARLPLHKNHNWLGQIALRTLYLGRLDGTQCWAAELPEGAAAPAGLAWAGLRTLYTVLEDDHFALAGRAEARRAGADLSGVQAHGLSAPRACRDGAGEAGPAALARAQPALSGGDVQRARRLRRAGRVARAVSRARGARGGRRARRQHPLLREPAVAVPALADGGVRRRLALGRDRAAGGRNRGRKMVRCIAIAEAS